MQTRRSAAHTYQHPTISRINVQALGTQVFFLYTSIAARSSKNQAQTQDSAFRGLGFLDSHRDVLTLDFTVQVVHDDVGVGEGSSNLNSQGAADLADTPHARRHAKRERAKYRHKVRPPEEKTITVELAQDTTALHSRKGDTGSVLWRAWYATHRFLADSDISPAAPILPKLSFASGMLE